MNKAGLNYNRIQSLVNGKMAGYDITKSSDEKNNKKSSKKLSSKDIEKLVNKVIRGNYGNGKARVKALTKAGYNYNQIQNKVNERILGKNYKKRSTRKTTSTRKTASKK